jgi:hypothetical protein
MKSLGFLVVLFGFITFVSVVHLFWYWVLP